MTSTLPPLVQAVAGSVGSAYANLLTYPLDLVTTRVQLEDDPERKHAGIPGAVRTLRSIIRKYGVQALYDGVLTDTGATLLSNFFYFYFYSYLREAFTKHAGRFLLPKSSQRASYKPNLAQELVLGFVAGVMSRAISTPLSLVTLRLQAERTVKAESDSEKGLPTSPTQEQRDTGVVAVMSKIYKKHGLAGFWKGFQMTTILSLNPSISMALFQFFRRSLDALQRRSLSNLTDVLKDSSSSKPSSSQTSNPNPSEAFLIGAVSSSISSALLYPLILAKTRLQVSSATSISSVLAETFSTSASESTSEKAATETVSGVQGLYQGIEMQILKGFLSQGVTFLVKGRIEQMIVAAYTRRMVGS